MDGWGGRSPSGWRAGAKVSVAARKFADLAWAESCGYGIEHTGQLEGWLCCYDLVVNTVPARILSEEDLEDLRPGCLVIDLASKPGGVDLEAAARLGVKVIWAPRCLERWPP